MTPAPVESTSPSGAASPGISGEAAFVWLVWALMLAAALYFVGRFGINIPWQDDWEMVPAITGHQPVTGSWLWSLHNEHRVPLPRLILFGLYRLTDNDFRAGMYLDVALLAGLTAALIVAARAARGRTRWSDAIFPLLLLHWGHVENLIWGWQVGFVMSAFLGGLVLAVAVGWGTRMTWKSGLAAGLCLVLLPFCGANGLGLVPALALWLGYCGFRQWKSGRAGGRPAGVVMLGLALAAVALIGLYFRDYQKPAHHPPAPPLQDLLRTTAEFLAMGFGIIYPYDQRWKVFAAAYVLLLGMGIYLAVRAWLRRPEERPRALGLMLFVGALLSVALGIGWGRGGYGPLSGLAGRYVSLAAPGLCAVYLLVVLYGPPSAERWARQYILLSYLPALVLVGYFLYFNVDGGLIQGRRVYGQRAQLARDLDAGLPKAVLASRYADIPGAIYPQGQRFEEFMSMLHQAGIAPFKELKGDFPLREIQFAEGRERFRTPRQFVLSPPRYVYLIRMNYSCRQDSQDAVFAVSWHSANDPDGKERRSFQAVPRDERLHTVTLLVDDTVTDFRVGAEGKTPGECQAGEVQFLVPESPLSGP